MKPLPRNEAESMPTIPVGVAVASESFTSSTSVAWTYSVTGPNRFTRALVLYIGLPWPISVPSAMAAVTSRTAWASGPLIASRTAWATT